MQLNEWQKPELGANAGAERGVHAASRSEPKSATKQTQTVDRASTLKRAEARAPAVRQLHRYGKERPPFRVCRGQWMEHFRKILLLKDSTSH